MIAIALLALAGAETDVDRLYAAARSRTAVAVRCDERAVPGEVTVCGRRRADRYRLPLTGGNGGTSRDPSTGEREALLVPPAPWTQMGPFLVGGGAFGAHATVSGDGKVRLKSRELSP